MRIVSIELNGFRRMALNGIKHFKLKPTARVQLILGANGSGKSSLIAELTPLPAIPANYTKDGSKIIIIEQAGDNYILTSNFASNQKHSFIKNDEELNDGGTASVQKELVKSTFGITQESHDVCTGVERFSTMSPSRKREILTELCDNDYDYALRVFAKSKEYLRDTTGALKMAKKRLVSETSKLVSPESIQAIENEITALIAEIDVLYRNRVSNSRTQREIEDERENIEIELIRASNKVLSFKFPNERAFTPEEIKSQIDISRQEVASLNTRIEIATREHVELKKSHEVFLKTGNSSAESLRTQIKELKDRRNGLLSTRKLGLEFSGAETAKTALNAILDNLQIVLVEFPENSERGLSQLKLQEWRQKVDDVKQAVIKIDTQLEQLGHQKFHMENLLKGDETQCPKCTHRWHPGYSKSAHDMVLQLIDKLDNQKQAHKLVLTEAEDNVRRNEQYGVSMRDYMRMVRATPVLEPFWSHLRDNDIIHTYPRQAAIKLEQLQRDIELSCQAVEVDKEIDRITDLLDLALKTSDSSMAAVTEKLEEVENNLGSLTNQLTRTQNGIQQDQLWLSKTTEFLANEEKVRQYSLRLKAATDEMIVTIRNDIINDCLRELQIELAKRQSLLSDFRMQQGIVDDIAKQVGFLEEQETVARLVMNELSPTDGLIAEGLLGFIRSFVRKMNIVIRKIWTYRLEVQDCSVGDGDTAELDYKFPLLVSSEENIVPDVKLASVGQREVVDMAFRIVATSYYGLNDAPLSLDEFSASFDKEHRTAAVSAIKAILEQLSFSQLFLVSHYEEQHGAFPGAQRCILTKNQTLQMESDNEHVVIQ